MTLRRRIVVAAAFLSFVSSPASAQSIENPDSLFLDAIRLQREGNVDIAKLKFRRLLNEFPQYHDARVQYGRLLAWDQRFDDADVQFDSVLFVQPSHLEARFAKAQALAWSGRYRQSANILLALLEESPRSVRVLDELSNVYLRGGAPRTALRYYEQAYLLAPTDKNIMRGLARTHRKLGNDALALYWYHKLLAASPGDPEARGEIWRLTYKSQHEIRLHGSYESFPGTETAEHIVAMAEYYFSLDEDWKPFVHFSRISKFGAHESRFGAGVYATLSPGLGMFFQALSSPDGTVAPDFDAALELNGGVFPSIELIGGYRFMRYDTLNVHVVMPGFTWYLEDDVWMTIRGYFGWVPQVPMSGAGTLTLVFRATPSTSVRMGGFTGNELFQATSVREISTLKSSGGLVGLKSRLNTFLAAEVLYQYTSRNLLGNSHLVTLTVSTLF